VRFVDTNVLLYAVSTAPAEAAKAATARLLLEADDLALSVQVLQEFYVLATRRSRRGALRHDQASALVEAFLRFRVQENTLTVMRNAMTTCQCFRISYGDAAVIEAARAIGCETVLSEDLAAGANYDGIRIRNPFSGAAPATRRRP
jgi:predicted nucleic acid-binding protein